MQLDKTRIGIRERSITEILDLSLQVAWLHARPLAVAIGSVALPLTLVNWLLLGWMLDDVEYELSPARYLWTTVQLVFIEAPLVSIPATVLLGRTMFLEPVTPRQIAGECLKLLPRLFPCVLLLRGVLPALALAAIVPRYDDYSPAELFLTLLAVFAMALRAFRPFINEIILLERNPLRAASRETITIGRRSSKLHGPSSGDLFARFIIGAILAVGMTVAIVFAMWAVTGAMLNQWNWQGMMYGVGAPLAMWIVVGYMTVVRFLSYLDVRIRREGWEVELHLRAAAARLEGQLG